MKRHRMVSAAIGIAAATIVISGCSSSPSTTTGGAASSSGGSSSAGGTNTAAYNAASDNIVNASTKTGGTLNLLTSSDCDSWDPQRTYYGWCWNMQRLFTRSLIGYQVLNGTKFTLAPDLATDMGTHNADYTQWTYTLKPGIKWSDGTAVTPMDIKYGVERLFATDVINGGPSSYFISGIKAPKNYAGPYKDGDDNVGITTTATTITFNLTGPNADFDYLMAMSAWAPVPYKVEGGPGFTGANYTKHPLSTGPFMIKSYTPNKSIVFVRNPYWSQATDTIRHPLVNEVDLTVDTNPVRHRQEAPGGHRRRQRLGRRAGRVPGADPQQPDAQGRRRQPGRGGRQVRRDHPVRDPERALPPRDLLRVGQGRASSGLTVVRLPVIRRRHGASRHLGLRRLQPVPVGRGQHR